MLIRLAIANLATIQSLTVELDRGFTVLTGETGAGKSILIDAIRFVLGAKASADRVRTGARETLVEAVFEISGIPEVKALLETLGIPAGPELVLRRAMQDTGRSRALANDCTVTQANLDALGQYLVNIHGQHDHQQLLDAEFHVRFLDAFEGLDSLRGQVAQAHRRHAQLLQERKRIAEQAQWREARRAELTALLKMIESARLRPEEKAELERELNVLTHTERLAQLAHSATDILYEGEEALLARLAQLAQLLQQAAAIDTQIAEVAEPLPPLRFQLEDLYRALNDYATQLQADPVRLDAVHQRLAEIEKVERRHGGSTAAALERAEAAREELAELERAEFNLEDLEKQRAEVAAGLHRHAQALSLRRKEAAARLTGLIAEQLRELGMDKVSFLIGIEPLTSPTGKAPYYTPGGMDRVEFLLSANPGQNPRPLRRIASGGELSRTMLALKSILARMDPTRTLIFDEVDAGIGGAMAEIVGNKLRRLGETHQVLCITHLPQIAALGHHHALVTKDAGQGETFTRIAHLQGEDKVREVARLLSGLDVSDHSLASAAQMIARGRQPGA